jgi:hypothetical protein
MSLIPPEIEETSFQTANFDYIESTLDKSWLGLQIDKCAMYLNFFQFLLLYMFAKRV